MTISLALLIGRVPHRPIHPGSIRLSNASVDTAMSPRVATGAPCALMALFLPPMQARLPGKAQHVDSWHLPPSMMVLILTHASTFRHNMVPNAAVLPSGQRCSVCADGMPVPNPSAFSKDFNMTCGEIEALCQKHSRKHGRLHLLS